MPTAMSVAVALPPPPLRERAAGLPGSPLTVGMPQLSLHGLSENWLLKECGHRHWLMLAELFGLPAPVFRDAGGATLYATFTGLSLAGARLDRVAEHDRLRIAGHIDRVSRTQYRSVQRIAANDRPVATLTLQSIFLKRSVSGDNRSVLRAQPHPAPRSMPEPAAADPFTALCQRFRRDDWDGHRGFPRAARGSFAEIIVDPCPATDFNGAGFLYFASFQAILDRADWALDRESGAAWVTTDRDLFYYGNINPGDRLTVRLCGQRDGTDERIRWFEILRASDGLRIADGFVTKGRRPAGEWNI